MSRERPQLIYLKGIDAPCRIRFSKRSKRVRINVRPGLVEVVAPPGTPVRGRRGIERFVRSKQDWIERSVLRVEARAAALKEAEEAAEVRYVNGARIPFRGGELVLDIRCSNVRRASVEFGRAAAPDDRGRSPVDRMPAGQSDGVLGTAVVELPSATPIEKCEDVAHKAVLKWASGLALKDARRWADHYGARLGKHPTDVRLGNQKTIWGSCAANGIIRINRKLIEAPPAAMEYVVAHEVAHLAVRNHSPSFWAKLGEIQPDWPERKALLKTWERSRALGRWTVG